MTFSNTFNFENITNLLTISAYSNGANSNYMYKLGVQINRIIFVF